MPFICHSYAIHMPFICALLEDNLQLPDGSIYSGESDAKRVVLQVVFFVSQLSQLDFGRLDTFGDMTKPTLQSKCFADLFRHRHLIYFGLTWFTWSHFVVSSRLKIAMNVHEHHGCSVHFGATKTDVASAQAVSWWSSWRWEDGVVRWQEIPVTFEGS